VHNYQGNFGVVIAYKGTPLSVNYGKLYSIEFYKSSYRSELYGILAGLTTLNYLITALQLQLPARKNLFLYCDNKLVVNKISSRQVLRQTVNQHHHPDVDIEMQVIHEISALESKECYVTIQHVKGHQDTKNQK
jgi:ribonuclease HI